MNLKDEWLYRLQSDPLFNDIKQELRDCRPLVPAYDHRQDNTNEWKSTSLMQQGFDLCLSVLKINLEKT